MEDLTGEKFGRLTVIGFIGVKKTPNGTRRYWYKVKCDCGELSKTTANRLWTGHTKSCRCLQKESVASRNWKHGLTRHPLHLAWSNMFVRCKSDWPLFKRNYKD